MGTLANGSETDVVGAVLYGDGLCLQINGIADESTFVAVAEVVLKTEPIENPKREDDCEQE